MQTVFRGRHFITLQDYTNEEIETMLDVSYDLKRKFAMGIDTP
ncbi:MAG: ornithine carbamoyltransferase, partial [Clostridium lundense]|nr:ornithine carbamoyltransferase [Clostridium lundense]